MCPVISQPETLDWLLENGPKQLELLFRTIISYPSAPLLIADKSGIDHDASAGATVLLGIPREKIVGRPIAALAPAVFKPEVAQIFHDCMVRGERAGVIHLLGPDGFPREVEYVAKGNVLPDRHVLALRSKNAADHAASDGIPQWVQDYALSLVDTQGKIIAWYAGAVRIYGFDADDAVGKHTALLYPAEEILAVRLRTEFSRAEAEGHLATEGWHSRKDGSRFWANSISMAVRDESGVLQGFARVVRDFTGRHESDEKLRRSRSSVKGVPELSTITGVATGEQERILEANDTFLELIGYQRDDLQSGALTWSSLTPLEFYPLADLAHDEGLRYGACTPFEKELIRKDGTRVPVLFTSALLKLVPYRWMALITDLRERNRQESTVEDASESSQGFEEMVGSSSPMKRVMRQVEVVAPTGATVLILGETGTGKELVARAIHRLSPRHNLPFVTLNCAAIPTGLLESELFGYERGAFTGALQQKIGRFEMAHRGTLFLDEVGDIPIDLQPKLLRALQEKSFERLGGTRTIPIDVRLVAATNRNLTQMMGDKLFRSDLYYRLKVFPVTTPPLRDRPDDIPVLARHFVRKYAAIMDRTIDKIASETMKALVSWSWPGNVRELENFIERSVILSNGPTLRAPVSELHNEAMQEGGEVNSLLEDVERAHILHIFRETGGVISVAANRLGIPRTTLNAMMKKLGISRSDL